LRFDKDGTGIQEFITPSNIVHLLFANKSPRIFDFFSVDLDSFDYDIIESILKHGFLPRVVCAEFNGTLDPNTFVKLQYEEGYTWDNTNKYGFSFGAGIKLFNSHGYTVIFNLKETNIFAVRSELLPNGEYIVTAKRNVYHPINSKAVFVNV